MGKWVYRLEIFFGGQFFWVCGRLQTKGGLPWREVPGYLSAQILGAFAGVLGFAFFDTLGEVFLDFGMMTHLAVIAV